MNREIAGMNTDALKAQEEFIFGKTVSNDTVDTFCNQYKLANNEFDKDKLALDFARQALACRGMCFYNQNKLVCDTCIRNPSMIDNSLFYFGS